MWDLLNKVNGFLPAKYEIFHILQDSKLKCVEACHRYCFFGCVDVITWCNWLLLKQIRAIDSLVCYRIDRSLNKGDSESRAEGHNKSLPLGELGKFGRVPQIYPNICGLYLGYIAVVKGNMV